MTFPEEEPLPPPEKPDGEITMTGKKFFNKKVKDGIFIFTMLLIPMLNFLVFWLYVNIDSIFLAFKVRSATGGGEVWSFANFSAIWREITYPDSLFVVSLKNTLKFFVSNIFITLPVSLLLCYFLYKKICGFKVFRFVFYLPSIVAPTVLVVLFKYAIAYKGPVYELCQWAGWTYKALLASSDTALKTILFYQIVFSFGGNIILLSGAMSHIEESIVEAAQLDGVTMPREIFQIVIPLIWPTISTLVIMAFVGLFSSSGPILLFTQGRYNTSTIAYWIYAQVYDGVDYYYPAAIGLICTVIGTPIALGVKWLLEKVLVFEEA